MRLEANVAKLYQMLTIRHDSNGRCSYTVHVDEFRRRLLEKRCASSIPVLVPQRPRMPGVLHASTWHGENEAEVEHIIDSLQAAVRIGLDEFAASTVGSASQPLVLDTRGFRESVERVMYRRAMTHHRCRRHLASSSSGEPFGS
jgi:hypothetical protein